MAKPLILILAFAALCGGCGSEPAPKPDPGEVERLVARLDSRRAEAVDERVPDQMRAKAQSADRLVAPLEKVQADRIDPKLALELIG